MDSSTPSLDVEHDSWEFYAEWPGRKFWLLVTDMGEKKLIQTEDASPLLKRIFSGNAAYVEFLGTLHSAISSDPRFNALEWVS